MASSRKQDQYLPEQRTERGGLPQLCQGVAYQWKKSVHLRHVRVQPLVHVERGKRSNQRARDEGMLERANIFKDLVIDVLSTVDVTSS